MGWVRSRLGCRSWSHHHGASEYWLPVRRNHADWASKGRRTRHCSASINFWGPSRWSREVWTGQYHFGIHETVRYKVLIAITLAEPAAASLISLSLPTQSPVPSLRCHPTSSFTLASATYSGLVQIWDIRSPKTALFSVSKTGRTANGLSNDDVQRVTKTGKVLGERLLALDWDGETLVAGGEDGEIGIWRARGE